MPIRPASGRLTGSPASSPARVSPHAWFSYDPKSYLAARAAAADFTLCLERAQHP
jgi:hypothetical protein